MRIVIITQNEPFYLAENLSYLIDILPEHSSILPSITKELSKANPGALIRPIGYTFYIMPPLNSSVTEINKLFEIFTKQISFIGYKTTSGS